MHVGGDQEQPAAGVLCQEEYVLYMDGFFFLSRIGPETFYMFGSKLLHLSLSSLVYTSRLHLNLLYTLGYYFFVLFATAKTSFVQLKISFILTDCDWAVQSCGVFGAEPGPHLSSSCACPPARHILDLHFHCTWPFFLCATLLC